MKRLSFVLPYCFTLLILCCIFYFVLKGYNFKLQIPLQYTEDALFSNIYIKLIIDNGWPLTSSYLSFPGIFQLYDYPSLDNFNFLIQRFLALWSYNPFVVMNIFYLLTFPMAAFTGLYTYKKLGLGQTFAIIAAILFAILPYHFWRNESHLYLTSYFAVPLWILLAFKIVNHEAIFNFKTNYLNRLAIILLLAIIVNTGVYYTFFGAFFLFLAGVIASINISNFKPFLRSLKILIFAMLIAVVSLAPNFLFTHAQGKDHLVAQRGFDESEVLGLEITQLILPIDGHRLANFAHVRDRYDQQTIQMDPHLINENSSASLGLIGALGFLASFGIIFIERWQRKYSTLRYAALFNLAGLLFGTICGFGTLFAMFISPNIRSYNRISVFIGFLSLFVFFKCLQIICAKYRIKPKGIAFICAIFLIIGTLDQISPNHVFAKNPGFQSDFESDAVFVKEIENIMPAQSAIFILPYNGFPEVPTLNKMPDYEEFRPYLHSSRLKWSYGAMKGRPIAIWQEKTANLAPPQMLNTLVLSGFSGIFIDSNGYADHAKSLEIQLSHLLQESPLISPNHQFIFFNLLQYKAKMQQQYGKEWSLKVQKTREPFFDKT